MHYRTQGWLVFLGSFVAGIMTAAIYLSDIEYEDVESWIRTIEIFIDEWF